MSFLKHKNTRSIFFAPQSSPHTEESDESEAKGHTADGEHDDSIGHRRGVFKATERSSDNDSSNAWDYSSDDDWSDSSESSQTPRVPSPSPQRRAFNRRPPISQTPIPMGHRQRSPQPLTRMPLSSRDRSNPSDIKASGWKKEVRHRTFSRQAQKPNKPRSVKAIGRPNLPTTKGSAVIRLPANTQGQHQSKEPSQKADILNVQQDVNRTRSRLGPRIGIDQNKKPSTPLPPLPLTSKGKKTTTDTRENLVTFPRETSEKKDTSRSPNTTGSMSWGSYSTTTTPTPTPDRSISYTTSSSENGSARTDASSQGYTDSPSVSPNEQASTQKYTKAPAYVAQPQSQPHCVSQYTTAVSHGPQNQGIPHCRKQVVTTSYSKTAENERKLPFVPAPPPGPPSTNNRARKLRRTKVKEVNNINTVVPPITATVSDIKPPSPENRLSWFKRMKKQLYSLF